MDAAVEKSQTLQDDPAYFYCDRTHTWMKKAACVDRHTKGLLTGFADNRSIPEECQDCEQGSQIAKEEAAMNTPESEASSEEKKVCVLCHDPDRKIIARGPLCALLS